MSHQSTNDPVYAMGRTDEETRRLERQGALAKRQTRYLFELAGIAPGMRLLDVGCGSGDVALLAAELVGPTGHVVGIDVNPAVVATAQKRAEAVGAAHVSFIVGDIREAVLPSDFDAVVGRLVLVYQADPVATVRAALRALRQDGLVVFYESDMGAAMTSVPESPLHQLLGRCINETFARAGLETAMGTKLHQVFCAAGLEAPHTLTDTLSGGGQEFLTEYSWWAANTLRSLLPLIVKFEIASPEEIDVETFEQRYCAEVLGQSSWVCGLLSVGAWTRKT